MVIAQINASIDPFTALEEKVRQNSGIDGMRAIMEDIMHVHNYEFTRIVSPLVEEIPNPQYIVERGGVYILGQIGHPTLGPVSHKIGTGHRPSIGRSNDLLIEVATRSLRDNIKFAYSSHFTGNTGNPYSVETSIKEIDGAHREMGTHIRQSAEFLNYISRLGFFQK